MKKSYENEIRELLSRMTLEEKIGQLQQCGPSLVGAFEVSFEELLDMMFDGRISQEEFGRLMATTEQDYHEEELRAGRVGSYNGIDCAATANRLQKIAVEETRLGIPLIFGYDVIHGYRTVSPIPLGESCAWEPSLWERTGRMAAEEATAGGVHMSFAPMVDVAKDARWGRVSEGAGEDALLNGLYGAAKVRGFQGDDLTRNDAMVACVKHFAAYGAGEAGRDYNRVDMSEQRLWEEYLPPYKKCVEAGARAIMPAFNDINGVPCSTNAWLLTEVLRKQWGFDGMTVSDANAIAECVNHGISANGREAAKKALNAGMDMDMTSNTYIAELEGLIRDGEVSEETLDRAVSDILRVKFELGLFENPYQTSVERESETLLRPEYRALAREAAVKSMVLLKNDGVLPLKKNAKLAVFGKNAAERGEMLGAWAVGAKGEDCVSLMDALSARGFNASFDSMEAVETADAVLVVLGENKDQSGEASSRADITLPAEQLALLDTLAESGKPVVVILFNGRPLAIPTLGEKANAILEAWHLGVEAGNALCDVLFGDEQPTGKLTVTFPGSTGQCPMYYAHMNTGRPGGKSKFTSKYLDAPVEPIYPFGFGLSYTSYAYENLQVKCTEDTLCVSVEVKNIGERGGEEIVQLYTRDLAAERVRPVRELKAFEKVALSAGETKTVSFSVALSELGYYDRSMNYRVDKGEYRVFVGGNSRDTLEQSFVL